MYIQYLIGNKTLISGSFDTIYKSGRKWCGNLLLCGGLVSILQDIAYGYIHCCYIPCSAPESLIFDITIPA